jgi:hypothetical protein
MMVMLYHPAFAAHDVHGSCSGSSAHAWTDGRADGLCLSVTCASGHVLDCSCQKGCLAVYYWAAACGCGFERTPVLRPPPRW